MPWRYTCPDCGSHMVRRLVGNERPKGKTYAFNGSGVAEAKDDRAKGYKCKECNERKPRLYDKKKGYTTKP